MRKTIKTKNQMYCNAYKEGNPCRLRMKCKLYGDFLAYYKDMDMLDMKPKPLTIEAPFTRESATIDKCKQFKER